MNIDVKTLFYIFSLGNYFIIFFLSVYVIFYKVKNPILYIFIISKILYAFLWILFALWYNIPWFYTIILSNVFLIFAITFDLYCIVTANKTFNSKHFKRFLIVPILFSILFILFSKSIESNRIILMSFIIAFLYISGGLLLLLKKNKTKIQKLVSFLCFLIAASFFYRSFWAYFKEEAIVLHFNSHVQIISYLFLVLGSFSFPMILLLILKEVEEEKIIINNKKLKLLNKNKTKFFSIIAHDLKGPLGTYTKMIELLLSRHNTMDPQKREDFIKKLSDSSTQTLNLLENLLQWSQSESGTLTVHPKLINLKEIINTVVLLTSQSVAIKNLNLTIGIHENETIYGDYNMILTVFRNLISNAIKFTPEKGKISISSFNINANYVEICIEDSGVGISKKHLNTIFDLESEIHTKGTNNESGTGLGLKLAQEFLHKNNGTIKLKSTEHVGTKVCVTLPKHNLQ